MRVHQDDNAPSVRSYRRRRYPHVCLPGNGLLGARESSLLLATDDALAIEPTIGPECTLPYDPDALLLATDGAITLEPEIEPECTLPLDPDAILRGADNALPLGPEIEPE
ncbi:hypothetical protein NPX13_g4338 [Xylaria arbuscula]|uniref:Uncharacterized protein n=1 Tax=Xylaria arbuscula TaxID=114810 RepID=A0A9W8NGJ2_9PEZI|nr:hypothetical protein NPX13_g4338 [Xylaria arbuscula]